MPTKIRLDDALDQILGWCEDVCNTARDGGLLDGITQVVSGEISRGRPTPPYLWIAVGAADATHATAMHEQWDVAILLSAKVRSEDPEDNWAQAFRWAARARSVVLADRTMGGLPFVEDVQSDEVGPLGHSGALRLFGAYARITSRIAILEPGA